MNSTGIIVDSDGSAEKLRSLKITLALLRTGDYQQEIITSGVEASGREWNMENLPDSLLNFSNKDSLYVNVVSISAMDDIPISQLLDSPEYVSEDSTLHVDQQGVCHWQADVSLNIEDAEIPQLSEGDISCRLNIEDTEIPQLGEWGVSCRLDIEDTEIPEFSKGDISCRLNIEDTEIPQLGEWVIRLNIEDTEILQLSEGGVSCRSNIEDTEIPQFGEWGISCRLNIEDTKIPQLSEGGVNCRSNIEDTELPQLSEGICRLSIEDPEIPCNDEIILQIHPSISFDLSITSIATDSIDPSSSSEDENDDEQESSASKVPALSFTQSQIVCLDSCSEFDFTHPLIGHILKSESSDTKCLDPLSGQCDEIRDPGKPQYIFTNSVLIGDRGFTEDGLDDSETDSEVSLQTKVGSLKMIDPESMDNSSISDHNSADSDGDLPCFSDTEALTKVGSPKMIDPESMDDSSISDHISADSDGDLPCFSGTEALTKVGSPKMIDPESMDDSSVSDHNNADSDGDLPCFSDIEALIHGIGLEYSQDSCITSEGNRPVARHHYNHSNRTITRPQQTARSSLQRAMSSLGALAIFYSRQFDYYIKKTEVTIGRSTADTDVDIDLRKEGRANMISRRQVELSNAFDILPLTCCLSNQATIKMDVDGTFTLGNIGKSSISMNGNSVAPGQVVALGSSSLIEGFVRLQWWSWLWIEYDALLLHNFLDILQDLYAEDLNETVHYHVGAWQESNGEMYSIWSCSHGDDVIVSRCSTSEHSKKSIRLSMQKLWQVNIFETFPEPERQKWEDDSGNEQSELCDALSVTNGSSLGAIFNHFTGKFDLSPSSQTTNKTAEQKEKSCIAAATVANKEVAAYNHFHMPSLVHCTILQSFLSPSRSSPKKNTINDPNTSQVIPEATSKKVTSSVGTDHRKAVVVIVIRDTASQPLNTKPIPTNGAAT
ncbi:SMAD/FHA domain, microspherule protein domain protein [Tanacetum coccineum]